MMQKPGRLLAMIGLAVRTLSTPSLTQDDARARKLIEEAFSRRYHWNEDLKGFTADFTRTSEGKTNNGSINVNIT